jgi:hypothetical protein
LRPSVGAQKSEDVEVNLVRRLDLRSVDCYIDCTGRVSLLDKPEGQSQADFGFRHR